MPISDANKVAAGLSSNPEAPPRIRVGRQAASAKLIYAPDAVYSPEAKSARVQGKVK